MPPTPLTLTAVRSTWTVDPDDQALVPLGDGRLVWLDVEPALSVWVVALPGFAEDICLN